MNDEMQVRIWVESSGEEKEVIAMQGAVAG